MKIAKFAGVVSAFALSGCAVVNSSQVDSSVVFTQYRISAEAGSAEMNYEASFFVGGSTGTYLRLDGQSEVTVDGSALSPESSIFNDVTYRKTDHGLGGDALSRCHAFKYVNNTGASYQNCIQPEATIALRADQPTSARVGGTLLVKWHADQAVGSTESLSASLVTPNGSVVQSASGSGNDSEFTLNLASPGTTLQPGSATLKLCRSRGGSVTNAPQAGGYFTTSYCASPINVTISN